MAKVDDNMGHEPTPPPASSQSLMADSPIDADTSQQTPSVATLSPVNQTQVKKKRKLPFSNDNEHRSTAKPAPKRAKNTPKADNERLRKKPEKIVLPHKTIPNCYDDCEDHDKKLIDLRDGGKSWGEIRNEWKKLTGSTPGASTLPNRYARLKSNFAVVNEEDNATLMACKQEIEDGFEKEKWTLIAVAMHEKGTELYHKDVLARQYKKLMLEVENPEKVKAKLQEKNAERELKKAKAKRVTDEPAQSIEEGGGQVPVGYEGDGKSNSEGHGGNEIVNQDAVGEETYED